MRRSALSLLVCGLCAALACARAERESFSEGTVAVFEGGSLTAVEVDEALLQLDPAERPAPGEETEDWYREFVRGLVFDNLLRNESEATGSEAGAEWARRENEARRRAIARIFIERLPPLPPPTDQEIREAYEADAEMGHRPARRLVAHIFLRAGPTRTGDQVRAELEQIRQRVLAGESFSLLAGELSESETRHRNGEMGWVQAEQLGTLAPQVFALSLRTPSEPVMTPQGGHVFYVAEAVEERLFEITEVKSLLTDRIMRRRAASQLEVAVESLPQLAGSLFVVDTEELRSLLAAGQDDAIVMRSDSFSLDLGALRRLLRGSDASGDPVNRARLILDQFMNRERIYQYAVSEGWLNDPEVSKQVEAGVSDARLRLRRERELRRRVTASRDEVEAYYEARRRRFMTPPQVALRSLRIPLEPVSGDETMRRLEAAVPAINSGAMTLEAVQEELGGKIRDLGWATLRDLASVEPSAAAQAAALGRTGCLPPFRRERFLHLFEIIDRRPPTARPFADVVTEVESAYVEENRESLLRSVRDDRLAEAGFRIVVDEVSTLVQQAALLN